MTDKRKWDLTRYTCVECERDNITVLSGEQVYDMASYLCSECEGGNLVIQAEVIWNYLDQRFDVKRITSFYNETQSAQPESRFGAYCNYCKKIVNLIQARKYIDRKEWLNSRKDGYEHGIKKSIKEVS